MPKKNTPAAAAAEETNPPAGEPIEPIGGTNPAEGETTAAEDGTTTTEDAERAADVETVPDAADVDTETGEVEPEKGPLSKLQDAVRDVLDFDQITEVRLALQARREDLEKHGKKGRELGVYETDADRRMRILSGDSTTFGLLRIFEREVATEQRDIFFERESPNGRKKEEAAPPAQDPAESTDETITFRTVDGRDITCHVSQLEELHLADLRALHTAGILPEHVTREIHNQDFWYLVEEAEPQTAGAGA